MVVMNGMYASDIASLKHARHGFAGPVGCL